MKKEVRCEVCGTKIPLEIEENELIRLGSSVCPKCNRMRCPVCGDMSVINYDEKSGVPIEFHCLNPECGLRKKILI